jgi:hypothetical protein
VPIGFLDAVIPFQSPYRPIWIGFGALALDLLLAVAITSGLRRRIGIRAWRGVHWLAYLCWPVALLHGLGSGTDTRLSVSLVIDAVCVLAVAGAVAWRLVTGRSLPSGRRIAAGLAGAAALVSIGVVAVVGPLASGWSRRAGTSPALLAQLNANFQSGASTASSGSGTASTPTGAAQPSTGGASFVDVLPTPPFTSTVQGTYRTSAGGEEGQTVVVLTMQPAVASSPPLVVKLMGRAVSQGVALSSSQVTWGPDSGSVSSLQGTAIGMNLSGPQGRMHLALQLNLDQAAGTLTGTISGTKVSTAGGSGA